MSVSVAVITCGPSDLLALLQKSPALTVEVLHPNALTPHCLDGFQCACVLGGTREEPLVFPAECRSVVEDFSHSGRRVLYEYTLSFCQNYCASPDSTRFLRLVCTDAEFAGLEDGLLLDDQCNMRCTPYYRNNLARPILMYKKGLSEHARQPLSQQERTDCQQYGIWLETPAVAVCSFRLCNFLRARFSPVPAWSRLVRSLIGWLCGAPVLEEVEFPPQYQTGFARSAADCAASGIDWFSRSGILVDEGKRGVLEGLGTEIYPDGHQKTASSIRTDCCGEAALAYLMHFLAFGDARSLERAQNLEAFVYDKMQIRSGRFQGMLRWTDIAWEVCYQDDMARAMLVTLFKALYGLGREYLPQCRMALEFLMNTTGPDGLRPARTDNLNMSEEDFAALSRQNGAFPCAHYNAFYLACLLLYGKLEVAKQMGADAVIDTSCEDLRTRVAELTNGRGVDVVLDNIGLEWSINEGVYMVRPGGKVLVCGYISEDFKVNYQEVMKFEKEILGMRGMTRQDMAEVVKLVNQRKIVPYVYKTVHFEQINEALGLLRDGKTKGRVVLLFPED